MPFQQVIRCESCDAQADTEGGELPEGWYGLVRWLDPPPELELMPMFAAMVRQDRRKRSMTFCSARCVGTWAMVASVGDSAGGSG